MSLISTAVSRLTSRGRSYMVVPSAASVLDMTVDEVYRTQPALRAVVGFLSDNVAQLPLKLYVRESDNNRLRDTTSAAAMLIDRPNAQTTTHELVRGTVSELLLYGNALWYLVPSTKTESGWEIDLIPWGWVVRTPTTDGMTPDAYEVRNPNIGTSVQVTLDAARCVRFAGYDPSGTLDPASPVESLKQVLAEQISAYRFRNQIWRNGGRISGYLTRPAQAAEWSPEQRNRFATSWKQRFSGEDGTNTGGTPLLEDGMDYKQVQFNAKEAEWSEATKLAREDVAAVYHVNPALIWHTDGQTYASAKDNARALYADTLAPILDMLQERVNAFVLPVVGAPANEYCEFDLTAKLNGSFEEQASMLTSAVGGPWMTADEARSRLNYPAMGGDAAQLIHPLNLSYGSSGEPSNSISSATPETKACAVEVKSRQTPDAAGSAKLTTVLSKFFERQSRRVLPEIDRAKARGTLSKGEGDGHYAQWWDARRWDRELADDLEPIFKQLTKKSGRATLRDLGFDADEYDADRTEHYVRAMAEGKARAINNVTYRQLRRALDEGEDMDEDAEGSTPAGVFSKAEDSRASTSGLTFATACAVWGSIEAAHQRMPATEWRRYKRWVHVGGGETDRGEHVAMDGETVGLDDTFSNGLKWPHDVGADPYEAANCRCQVEIVGIRK